MMTSIGDPTLWTFFLLLVAGLLALDLGVFHRQAHVIAYREAAAWSAFWIALSLAFNAWIFYEFGSRPALEFFTGYVLEKALSVDNIFVFIVIFNYFSVPAYLHHRVLFWGILGAILLRGIFILAGAALIARFEWILYVFGAFLVYTGWKLLRTSETEVHPERNPLVLLARRVMPMTSRYHGQRFFLRRRGILFATPLFLVLVVVEATDVVFAVDSIPAIFAVTLDPFIVFTSNIFAILGLRALYFLLAGLIDRFQYLRIGLGLVLAFIGVKMLVADVYHVPIQISLLVISLLLGGSIAASWWKTARRQEESGPAAGGEDEPGLEDDRAGGSAGR